MPMRFFTIILMLALSPAIGLAQSSADVYAASAVSSDGSQHLLMDQLLQSRGNLGNEQNLRTTMPLWSTPDGRILAMVALGGSNSAPVLPQSPQIGSAADWQLVDVTGFVAGGVSMRFGNNATVYANLGHGIVLGPFYPASLSLDCGQSLALGIGEPCTRQSIVGDVNRVRLGADWNAGDIDLDLNYGLSWLRLNDQTQGQRPAWDLFAGIGDESLPTLVIPGIEFANVQNSGLSAQGRWRLDDAQSINLGAALSRIQFEMPGTPLLPSLNQAALSFGLNRGDFSGLVVGRMLGPADPISGGQHWSSVDLGISWRAPWRGIFSVGAQNIWSSGNLPALTDPTAHEADASQARVPYVQYHQDL
jgi:hypothetical protein